MITRSWLFILFFILLFSCNKKENPASYLLPEAEKFVSESPFQLNYHYQRGKVELKMIGDDLIADLIPTQGFEEEPALAYRYLLQTERQPEEFSYLFEDAEVLFLQKNILINDSATGFSLLFTVQDSPKNVYLAAVEVDRVFSGFGIGFSTSRNLNNLAAGPICKCWKAAVHTCESGGVGAESCSASSSGESCSVTCKGAYYACCNGDLNGDPGGEE